MGGTDPTKHPQAIEGIEFDAGARGGGGGPVVVTVRRSGVLGNCSASRHCFVAGSWDAPSLCPQPQRAGHPGVSASIWNAQGQDLWWPEPHSKPLGLTCLQRMEGEGLRGCQVGWSGQGPPFPEGREEQGPSLRELGMGDPEERGESKTIFKTSLSKYNHI